MGIKKSISFICAIITIGLIILSCNKKPSPAPVISIVQKSITARYDTVTSLAQMHSDTVIWKLNGKCIMVTHENSTDEEEFEMEEQLAAKINATESSACSDAFAGSARASAKTSYATPPSVTFANIAALRASMQTDTYMHTRHLTTSSARITEENRNVSVTSAYLYAISRESDNDYHMIIGDASHAPTTLLNCECGGLPATSASSYTAMKAVRNYIKAYFGTDFCGHSGYTKFVTPIRITILKGSLFYDIDHSPGSIGPTGLRANTSWEMHPINAISF